MKLKHLIESKLDPVEDNDYIQADTSERSDYPILIKQYGNMMKFRDIDKESSEIRDLIDMLTREGRSYQEYKHKTDNGLTIFYEGISSELNETLETSKYEFEIAEVLDRMREEYESGIMDLSSYRQFVVAVYRYVSSLEDNYLEKKSNNDVTEDLSSNSVHIDLRNPVEIEEQYHNVVKVRYYYDRSCHSWVICALDEEGNYVDTEYVGNKLDRDAVVNRFCQEYSVTDSGRFEKNESFNQRSSIDLDRIGVQVYSMLDVDALGEDDWIEFHLEESRRLMDSSEVIASFEAIGEDKTLKGHFKTSGQCVNVKFRNGVEKLCCDAKEIAAFIAEQFGVTL